MNNSIYKPELLLPSGDFESVKAAVQNGADAVYLGGKNFSARQNAANFDADGLKEAVSYCHARGVKVYETFNTVLFDRQFPEAETALRNSLCAGVDAFIVQDFGAVSLLSAICPGVRIHASTQMSVHTPDGARLLKEMGIKRVVLARELSLTEIREIIESVEIETEVFVHGALCMSVSGQCYLSAMIGGRSGNRGCCAGPCRLPFTADGTADHALSLKDLCLTSHIRELMDIGVASFKVEGRMKRPEYVAAAADAYSKAIRGETPELDTLQAVFSRSGFTDGYLTGHTGSDMFGFRRKEDVVSATAKLLKSLQNSYQKERGQIPLSMTFTGHADEPCRLTAQDPDQHTVSATGMTMEKAEHKSLDEETAVRQLQKLGGTIFSAGTVTAEIDPGITLPLSELNRLRREVCLSMQKLREQVTLPSLQEVSPIPAFEKPKEPPVFCARFRFFNQIPFEEIDSFLYFSLPLDEVISHAGSLSSYRDRLVLEPDRVMFHREETIKRELSDLKEKEFHHLLCQNPAHLFLAKELGFSAHGSAFLNCTNSRAAQKLAALGVSSQTLSFELNLLDARSISAPVPLGLICYGYLPLMITRNCPIKNKVSCDKCKGTCSLTDRMGISFRVICNAHRYSELLNSQPLYLGDRWREFSGFSYLTFYFTVESQEDCRNIVKQYQAHLPYNGQYTRGLYYRNV